MSYYITLHYITRLPGHYSDGLAIVVIFHYSALYYKVTRTLFWRPIVNSDTSAISSGAKEWLWTLFGCWINVYKGNIYLFNPFHANDLFWYPLKTSENQRFSDVFREYQKRSVSWNGLKSNGKRCEIFSKLTIKTLERGH